MKKYAIIIILSIIALGLGGCEDITGYLPTTVTLTQETTTALSEETTTTPSTGATTTDPQVTTVVPTTLPATTNPVTTAPPTTETLTTAPVTSDQPTTTPPTTEPQTTLPATTEATTAAPIVHPVQFLVDQGLLYEVDIAEGSSLAAPPDPVKEGHKFLGWFAVDSPTAEVFPVTVNQPLSYAARFEPYANHFFLRLKNQTATTVEVEVVLGGTPLKINGYDVRVTYDAEHLAYASHVNNVSNIINPTNPEVIIFNYSDIMAAFTNETVILTLTFTITAAGETPIGLTIVEATVVDESFNIDLADTNASGLVVVLPA